MRSRLSRSLGVAGLLLAATGWTSAAGVARNNSVQASSTSPVLVEPAGPAAGPARDGITAGLRGSVQGAARQSNNTPLPAAMVRLRNVITGKLQDTTMADDAGNFVFSTVPDGTYVVELVTRRGKILMVGQVFTVAPGETVAALVRLGPKVPWFNGFFNSTASSVSSAAALAGVTAIAPDEIPPVSAVR